LTTKPNQRLATIPPLERTRLVDEITHHLRELIISGQLLPGSQLLQVELAGELGVSRTPLREAFRILERDGLVRISNGNRTIEVIRWTSEELRDLYEVREVVDGLAARLVAKKGVPAEVDDALREALAKMELSVDTLNHALQLEGHTEFHAVIAENCGNARVTTLLPLIRMTSSSLFPATDAAYGDSDEAKDTRLMLEEGLAHHRAIYEALIAGNQRRAEDLARKHIRATLKSGLIERASH
jgi:GntR family transcriptional regulator, vanillate catabolism transcriptional regulator